MFLHSSSPSRNSVTFLHSIILVSKKPFHSPVGSCEKETWVVHVLVWLTLLLHPKLLEARLPCLWLLNGDVTGCGIVGWSRDLPLRSLRARAPARQPASRQRPRHGRPASKPASKFCSGTAEEKSQHRAALRAEAPLRFHGCQTLAVECYSLGTRVTASLGQ